MYEVSEWTKRIDADSYQGVLERGSCVRKGREQFRNVMEMPLPFSKILWPPLWHVEVPGSGIKSEPQL